MAIRFWLFKKNVFVVVFLLFYLLFGAAVLGLFTLQKF